MCIYVGTIIWQWWYYSYIGRAFHINHDKTHNDIDMKISWWYVQSRWYSYIMMIQCTMIWLRYHDILNFDITMIIMIMMISDILRRYCMSSTVSDAQIDPDFGIQASLLQDSQHFQFCVQSQSVSGFAFHQGGSSFLHPDQKSFQGCI